MCDTSRIGAPQDRRRLLSGDQGAGHRIFHAWGLLNDLHAHLQSRRIGYWRDKDGHEIDFVLSPRGRPPVAIECKWTADGFDPAALLSFRRIYPKGESYVVASDVDRPFARAYGSIHAEFVNRAHLVDRLQKALELPYATARRNNGHRG